MVWGIVSHARERWHEGVRVEGFNPLRGATTGVVMRRRATTGVDGTRGVGFCFFFGGCSSVERGILLRLFEGGCGRGGLDHGSGQTRMPPQSDGTRGFWFCGGALLLFVLRACCGSMCWPVDRPATHAAAGAAARGVRGWGVESAARGERWSAHSAPSRCWSDATRINALFGFVGGRCCRLF